MMKRLWIVLVAGLLVSSLSGVKAAEKIQLGTAIKLYPHYYLPVLAGEEKEIWKKNGLEVEWVPFSAGAALVRAAASGAINIGLVPGVTLVQAVARGVPVLIVSDLVGRDDYWFWVRTDSRLRTPMDLKGAKVGVPLLGGSSHAYGRALAKALGLEKEVKFVGAGGSRENVATLKAGAIDAAVMVFTSMANLKAAGEVKEFLNTGDYLPKEWVEHVVFARKDFIKTNPDMVRRVLRGVLQGVEFTLKNSPWATEKMKELSGFPVESARLVVERLPGQFTRDGRINRKAVENLRDFLMEYEIIPRDKPLAVEELFTSEFAG